MTRTSRRLATTTVAALLAIGGTSVAAISSAGAQTADPPATITDPTAPVSMTVTVHLPLIGDVTLTVDTATGEISDVSVTPLAEVAVSDPVVADHHITIDVTYADGTTATVVLEVEGEDGGVSVEIGAPDDGSDDDGDHSGPPPIEDRGESAEHRQDFQGHRGHGEGIPESNVAPTPPTPENDQRGDVHSQDQGQGRQDRHDDGQESDD